MHPTAIDRQALPRDIATFVRGKKCKSGLHRLGSLPTCEALFGFYRRELLGAHCV